MHVLCTRFYDAVKTLNGFNTIAIVLTIFCTLIACGCRERPLTVGVIPRTTGTLLWEPMHLVIAEVAGANEMHIYWIAPADEGESDRQLKFINRSLKQYRALILAPDETLACRSLVLSATEDRKPVVIVDDELGPPPGPFLSYISSDEEVGARLAADRI